MAKKYWVHCARIGYGRGLMAKFKNYNSAVNHCNKMKRAGTVSITTKVEVRERETETHFKNIYHNGKEA